MKTFSSVLFSLFLAHVAQSRHAPLPSTKFLQPRDNICTPLAEGWTEIDDSPAINAALQTCGDGGTIILPADQIYSIRTFIDFTPCKNCDFQIEGQLIVADGRWDYWTSVDAVFLLSGVKGVRIRSLTGKGMVDGNAIPYDRRRWDSGMWTTKAFALITNGSSDVQIDNLQFKNVMQRFFRSESSSKNITFSNLNLALDGQWGAYPRKEYDAVGIELGQTTDITITNINMNFKPRPEHAPATLGICIAVDAGTHRVSSKNITCKGAFSGAIIALDIIGSIRPSPELEANTVSDILFSGITFDGDAATGFRSGFWNFTMTNLVWEDVTVIAGNPAINYLCWLKSHSNTQYYNACRQGTRASATGVVFKGFRGKLGAVPDAANWNRVNEYSVQEVKFEDWRNSTAV